MSKFANLARHMHTANLEDFVKYCQFLTRLLAIQPDKYDPHSALKALRTDVTLWKKRSESTQIITPIYGVETVLKTKFKAL